MKRILALSITIIFILFPTLTTQAAAYGTSYQQQLATQEAELYQLMIDNFKTYTPAFQYTLNPPVAVTGEGTAEQVRRWVYRAYEAAYRDHPEIFWVTKSGGMNISLEATTGTQQQQITSVSMKVIYTDIPMIPQKQAKLEATVSQILAAAPASPYEKVLYFHDTITRLCSYDERAKVQPRAYPESYEAYGALVNKQAVCEGYAKAFKLLCDRSGISSVLVGGMANSEAHMWNYVQLEGKYYLLDATFDDPINGTPNRDYFLKGSATTADHTPDSFFIENFDGHFTDPLLNVQDYKGGVVGKEAPATTPITPTNEKTATTEVPTVPETPQTPAAGTTSPPATATTKQNCLVQYRGKSIGGNFTVAFAGVPGALDLKQAVLTGVCLEVHAYPQAGYTVSEIKAEMGAGTASIANSNTFTFAVVDDCTITVTFQKR